MEKNSIMIKPKKGSLFCEIKISSMLKTGPVHGADTNAETTPIVKTPRRGNFFVRGILLARVCKKAKFIFPSITNPKIIINNAVSHKKTPLLNWAPNIFPESPAKSPRKE